MSTSPNFYNQVILQCEISILELNYKITQRVTEVQDINTKILHNQFHGCTKFDLELKRRQLNTTIAQLRQQLDFINTQKQQAQSRQA